MLRPVFVLVVGAIGSGVGLAVALAVPCGTFSCTTAVMVFGVTWGFMGSWFLENKLLWRQKTAQPSLSNPQTRRKPRMHPPIDFQKRLCDFVSLAKREPSQDKIEHPSSVPYWSASGIKKPTPAKSSRYIRLVLLRIRQILRS